MALATVGKFTVTMTTVQNIFATIFTNFRWIAYLQDRRDVSHFMDPL